MQFQNRVPKIGIDDPRSIQYRQHIPLNAGNNNIPLLRTWKLETPVHEKKESQPGITLHLNTHTDTSTSQPSNDSGNSTVLLRKPFSAPMCTIPAPPKKKPSITPIENKDPKWWQKLVR
jgi:hypothetical protein